MATVKEEGAVPDFLRMDQPVGSDPANARKAGNWHGWPTKDITPVILTDDEGRTVRIRTPVMDLEGLKAWKDGRVEGYRLLEAAVDTLGFYDRDGNITCVDYRY